MNAPSARRSRKVRDWQAEQSDRLELHFLPARSPELNPDELGNTDLQRSLPIHIRAPCPGPVAAETHRFFHHRQHQPRIVRGHFGGAHVHYTLE
ncbi:transposase [Streptomyces sp. NBC_00286]|uniref:transposase n=1 Tax=Streptomyces sp. NBC_00286 TaxID=2975701 RepID=UPI002E2BEF09|nr:transposase [Streptomyces sp. NBC_00286]